MKRSYVELRSVSPKMNDVSIIIGENGSGKSELLNKLSMQYRSNGMQVLAISSSVHDKFTSRRSKSFHFLGGRHGKHVARDSIKLALSRLGEDQEKKIASMAGTLEFTGYDGRIGLMATKGTVWEHAEYEENLTSIYYKLDSPSGSVLDPRFRLDILDELNSEDKHDLSTLIRKLSGRLDSIIWLEMRDFSFATIDKSTFARVAKWEHVLKKIGVIDSLDISLSKNGEVISLTSASSGELSVISSIIYIAAVIDERTAILIDEPENSLHPQWQRKYISNILDFFYLYQPKIVVATHSPIVVSGAEVEIEGCNIYAADKFELQKVEGKYFNVEKMLFELFGVLTPESNYLSNYFVKMLNSYGEGRISLDDLNGELADVEHRMYDRRQIDLISGAKDIALKIARDFERDAHD